MRRREQQLFDQRDGRAARAAKERALPITLQCTAYDNQYSGCVDALTGVNAESSSDDGVTWAPATTQPPLPGFLIDSVATTGTRLVIGSYNGKIFVSEDDGDTWTPAATNPVANSAINGVACRGHLCERAI